MEESSHHHLDRQALTMSKCSGFPKTSWDFLFFNSILTFEGKSVTNFRRFLKRTRVFFLGFLNRYNSDNQHLSGCLLLHVVQTESD